MDSNAQNERLLYDASESHTTTLLDIDRSSTYVIPGAMSEDESQALIEVILQQGKEYQQRAKDFIYSILLLVNGGLVALSLLIVGALISLSSVDLAVSISLIAFAGALPLLAASFWSIKIWYGTPLPPRSMQKATAQDGQKLVYFQSTVDLTGLWIILLTASITMIGIVAALWHAFWGAGVTFILALIIGCILVVRLAILSNRLFPFGPRDSRYYTHINQWYKSKGRPPFPQTL